MMLNEVVRGYSIRKYIGHGHTGDLFLAINPAGRRLVIQPFNSECEPQRFSENVQEALCLSFSPGITTELTDSGTPVFVAEVDLNRASTVQSTQNARQSTGVQLVLFIIITPIIGALTATVAWRLKPVRPIVIHQEKQPPPPLCPVCQACAECAACPVCAPVRATQRPYVAPPEVTNVCRGGLTDKIRQYANRNREAMQHLPQKNKAAFTRADNRLQQALAREDCIQIYAALDEMKALIIVE
jgi:hypothetical protein